MEYSGCSSIAKNSVSLLYICFVVLVAVLISVEINELLLLERLCYTILVSPIFSMEIHKRYYFRSVHFYIDYFYIKIISQFLMIN